MVLLNIFSEKKVNNIFNKCFKLLNKNGILAFSDLNPICKACDNNYPHRYNIFTKDFSYYKKGSKFSAILKFGSKKIEFKNKLLDFKPFFIDFKSPDGKKRRSYNFISLYNKLPKDIENNFIDCKYIPINNLNKYKLAPNLIILEKLISKGFLDKYI